ncbi:agmatinase family protein [Sphingomonas profundi]|uniref:agmatinase family protein n=1 Tax=Alterirhizorhabdus profundi TaxID=2681549 RepID=UPI0018D062B3|nr:agmatinase family protein [Sphingomonas profundi]
MRTRLKLLAAALAMPLLLSRLMAAEPTRADLPQGNVDPAKPPVRPGGGAPLVKGPPTRPGEIPRHIDAYTPGLMPVEPLTIPADVMARLKPLPADKIAFIQSGRARVVVRGEVLFDRVRKAASAQQIEAYVDAIIAVAQQVQFRKGRDPETIPLDTRSPRFNDWHLLRPPGLNPKRQPGPIVLSRYLRGGGGFSTFNGSPVAFTPQDLIAGKVDVAILGAPLDMGSGWRDARHGPNAMRVARIGTGGTDVSSMISPNEVLNIVDYGNVAIDQMSTERSVQEVRRMVREIARTKAIPVIIGGDHSLEYPNVAAMADVYGKGNVGVIHFDSHLDTGRGRVHLLDHGQPIYRVMKEGHIRPEDYIQVGLRAHYTKDYYEWERLIGMHYHTMAEVERRGWDAVMERVVKEASKNTKYLYISFDVDVLDPAFEPGTGTPVAGGLTMREAIPIMRRLCAESNVVGFDIVELAPQLDPTYRSALNGNSLMFACLTGIAMRKKGIVQANYFSPLSSEHGQDNYYGAKK